MNLRKICFCNEVLELEIVNAIKRKGARTLEDVQRITRTGIDCGKCKPLIRTILERELPKLTLDSQPKLDL